MKKEVHFAENLKYLRERKGLQQEELGHKIGVGRSTISGYETGGSTPEFSGLISLISFFNVSAEELLFVPMSNHTDMPASGKYRKKQLHSGPDELTVLKEEVGRLSKVVDHCFDMLSEYKNDLYDLGLRKRRKSDPQISGAKKKKRIY